MNAKLKPQWVIAPLDGKTNLGADIIKGATYTQYHGLKCYETLYEAMPSMIESTNVWTARKDGEDVKILQQYDLMSVIHDVSRDIVDEFSELGEWDKVEGFVRAGVLYEYMSSVQTLRGVIANAAYGYNFRFGIEVADKKRKKYNGWLEAALKQSIPNSLLA